MGFVSVLFGILSSDTTLQDELSSTGNISIVYFFHLYEFCGNAPSHVHTVLCTSGCSVSRASWHHENSMMNSIEQPELQWMPLQPPVTTAACFP